MDYYGLSLLIASLLTGVGCQQLTELQKEEFAVENSNVTLSYTYSKQATGSDYFYWYRQYPGKSPEFLISHLGTGAKIQDADLGFSFNVSEDKTQMNLLISSAAVTDSAVYYCAVRPNYGGGTGKMIFGTGTRLTIQTKKKNEPDYYNLGPADDDDTTVCLATGFTRHNATMNKPGFDSKTASQITDFSGKPSGVYSQVAFLAKGEECGDNKDDEGKPKVPCDANLEPDEMVNLASITIFGLRVIFMKTVAFNVLMTLRLWMSQ